MPFMDAEAIPTGGVIGITFATAISGNITLSRAVSGSGGLSAFTPILTGNPLSTTGENCYFLDLGAQTPGPLIGSQFYVYQLTDVNGTIESPPIQPASNVKLVMTPWLEMVLLILQGAVNTAVLPTGIKPARVFNAMPLGGSPPLPLIAINQDLLVQANTGIGRDDPTIGDLQPSMTNNWTQSGQDRHMMRITVVSLSAVERDFYRTFVIGNMRIALAYAFSQMGADLIYDYEATSYQESDPQKLIDPGWYACDVLLDFTAESNVVVTTNYGLIETITTASSGQTQNLQVQTGIPDTIIFDGEDGPDVLIQTEVPIQE